MTPRDYEDPRRERDGRRDTQQGQQGSPTQSIGAPDQTANSSAGNAPTEVRRDSREARAARDARYIAAMAGNDQQHQRSASGAATQPGQFGGYGAGDDAFGQGTETRSGGASGGQGYGYERRVERVNERVQERGHERRALPAQGEETIQQRQEPRSDGHWDPRMGGAGRRAQMAEGAFERSDSLGRGGPSARAFGATGTGSMAGLPGLNDGRVDPDERLQGRLPGRRSEEPGWQGSGQVQRQFDPDYHQWRAEQMRKLDEDYEQWKKERYQKFSEEFDAWRKQRLSGREPQGSYSGNDAIDRAQRESRQAREAHQTPEKRSSEDQRGPVNAPNAGNPGASQELPDAGSASAFGSPPLRSAATPAAHERAQERAPERESRSGGILSSLLGTDKNK